MELEFTGPIWTWRGPAPFHFVTVPAAECSALQMVAPMVTYGWGMVPVTARIGDTEWATALWPKDGGYVLPLKALVRRAERLEVGDLATVTLRVDVDTDLPLDL